MPHSRRSAKRSFRLPLPAELLMGCHCSCRLRPRSRLALQMQKQAPAPQPQQRHASRGIRCAAATVEFAKYHGLGNDFILVFFTPPSLSRPAPDDCPLGGFRPSMRPSLFVPTLCVLFRSITGIGTSQSSLPSRPCSYAIGTLALEVTGCAHSARAAGSIL